MSLQVNPGGDLNHLSTGLYPRGHLFPQQQSVDGSRKALSQNNILWAKKLNCLFQSSFLFVNMTHFHDRLNAIPNLCEEILPLHEK